MIWICHNWILMILKVLLHYLDNMLIINIGMIFLSYLLKILQIVNIWHQWIQVLVLSLLIQDIKDISGLFLFHSLIMNLYSRYILLSLEDILNNLNQVYKNKEHLLLKLHYNYINLLLWLSEKQLLISIMNLILDIYLMYSKDYY
jgi:hypothetical protein